MKFKEGFLYEVQFKDHAVGVREPMLCHAVGYVLEDRDDYVYFSSWIVKTKDIDLFNSNLESFVVLKACIESRRLLCKTRMK